MLTELYDTYGCLKVFVYFNLHRKCWSIKALEGAHKGRVIEHADEVSLDGPVFKVSEAGRQRVLREGRKNVHAGVVGWLRPDIDYIDGWWEQAYYNPRKVETFVRRDTGGPIKQAKWAVLNDERQVWFKDMVA
ncbi:hypothetical protein UFOVP149_43 [uncultured Caudovirales phage]|uniref:Uncharacterized protein n=1 Tax=uncultured Caudovirales phage TaxID=2100421 RepID=A0A6J7WA66_9CAUD|nr:hypothetical protein UFOVP149_43 [uncultured Caudovirales phage]